MAKTGHADLLLQLPERLVVPLAVASEIHSGGDDSRAWQWIERRREDFAQPEVITLPAIAAWDLGAGESAVLSWAHDHHSKAAVVTDDLAGRRCARAFGLPITGTLGVVLLAKEEGVLPAVKPLAEALVGVGLRADDALLEEVLRQAGEA